MIRVADRLNQIEEYYFSKKLREVKKLELDGRPIINMGVGSPDLPAHSSVIEALQNALTNSRAHMYQSYKGLPELRKGISEFTKHITKLFWIQILRSCL